MTKFCKDCKHAVPEISFFGLRFKYKFAKCDRTAKPPDTNYYYVTGEENKISDIDKLFYCSTERDSNRINSCGPEAQYFEAKQ